MNKLNFIFKKSLILLVVILMVIAPVSAADLDIPPALIITASPETTDTVTTILVTAVDTGLELTGTGGPLATITGGSLGQTLVILSSDDAATFNMTDSTGADKLELTASHTMSPKDTLIIVYNGTQWYETGTKANN